MALLESNSISLGTVMPDFTLQTPDGKDVNAYSCNNAKGLLIVFTCNHCPYAQAIWDRFITLAKKIRPLGINTIAVNPNINPNYPEDSPTKMFDEIRNHNIDFPYLVDDKQEVAKAYEAVCTPDIYLLNDKNQLVYHGRFDDNWKDVKGVIKKELEEAAIALVNGKEITRKQLPSMGCSIKWCE